MTPRTAYPVIVIITLAVLSSPLIAADPTRLPVAPSDVTAEQLALWNDPAFRTQFAASYMAETDIEPRVTADERDEMLKILDLISAEKMDDAVERLDKRRNPAATAVYDFTAANIAFQQDRLDTAAAAYRIAVEKYPKFRRAWKNLGLIAIRQGDFPAARTALTRVVSLGGTDAVTYGLLGYACANLDQSLPAESAYRQAILLDPDTPDWTMGLARSLFKQQRFAQAVALCDQLIAEHPDRPDLWLLQASAYIGLNQPLKAAEIYELVDHLGASTPATLATLGDITINEGLYDTALAAYRRAMQADPNATADRPLRAAKVLCARGALPQADTLITDIEHLYSNALTTAQRKDLLKLQARIAVANGNDADQVAVLEQIVSLDPLDGEALILLGQHCARTGDTEQAEFYYQRAANIDAYEADAKVRHAQLLVNNGRYSEALPLLRRAQALKPRDNVGDYLAQVERINRTQ